jgi:hypothetical protein
VWATLFLGPSLWIRDFRNAINTLFIVINT